MHHCVCLSGLSCLSVYLSVYLSIWFTYPVKLLCAPNNWCCCCSRKNINLYVHHCVCLSVWLSVCCLSCLSVGRSVWLSVYLIYLPYLSYYVLLITDVVAAQERILICRRECEKREKQNEKERKILESHFGKSRNRRTFLKIENLRFLQNYDDYNGIFGIKLKLYLSFEVSCSEIKCVNYKFSEKTWFLQKKKKKKKKKRLFKVWKYS